MCSTLPVESENGNLTSTKARAACGVVNRLLLTQDGGLTFSRDYVRMNVMRVACLQKALDRLVAAIRDVESELAAMEAEHDPLASHIFVSRRHYRNVNDTKSGKRRETMARLSFNIACELGFRGNLDEWERLMGAVARR